MDGLTEGRIVHYVMPSHEHRPAIIVKVWRHRGPDDENGQVWLPPENGVCNLTVFVDGTNDVKPAEVNWDPHNNETLLMRATSVLYSEKHEPFTWHWIEKA